MPHDIAEILTRLSPGKFDATRAANFDIERAKGALESAFSVESVLNFDAENRTVDFAFATDQPIEHWFGMLSLDVSKKAVDLSRVEAGVCPFLVNHNRDDLAGVIVPRSVELGPTIRGKVKFSRSTRGEEILNDVNDGIRNGGSIGFLVIDMKLENEKEVRSGAIPMYRATKWMLLEYSSASVPADIDCGAGRSFEKVLEDPPSRAISTPTEKIMTQQEIDAAAAEEAKRTAAPAVVETDPELSTVAEIRGWAKELKVEDLATTYLRDCKLAETPVIPTKDGFFAAVRKAAPQPIKVPVQNPIDVARNQGGSAIQLATSLYRGGPLKSFKGENAIERAHRAGMFLLAALGKNERALAFCAEHGIPVERAHSGNLNSTGGIFVPDEFDAAIIDLRIQYGSFRPNADVVPMASDTKHRPRRTGGLTAYFRNSGQAATESTKSWDAVTLVAKLLSVLTKYENELNEDAVINIGDDLTSEIAYAFANKEDECGWNGDGTDTYGGMVGVRPKLLGIDGTIGNIKGLKVASGNNWSEITLGDMQGLIGLLPQFARRSGGVKFYCSHTFYANVLLRLAQAVGGVTYSEVSGMLKESFFGVPVEIVEVMPVTEGNSAICLLYGNLAQAAMLGDRKGTTIAMTDSDSTDFAKGIMAIRGDTRFDVNVHDVGSTTVAGPIVGLITASS